MRKSASELFNIINFEKDQEYELILEKHFLHHSEKRNEDFDVFEGTNPAGEKIQFFGAGLLTHQINAVREKKAMPVKIWVLYRGKKEVAPEISQAGYVNDYKVEFDDGEPCASNIDEICEDAIPTKKKK